jgi:hypothetical protein
MVYLYSHRMPSVADVCKKFYTSYYELDCETQKKLAAYLREVQAHINPASVREQTYSTSIVASEESQYEHIVSILRVLCPSIVSTTRETTSKQKLQFNISWKGTFIVPNQFCDNLRNSYCANNKTEPFVVRLRGKMSEWQTVEVPDGKHTTQKVEISPVPVVWTGRLRTSSSETLVEPKTKTSNMSMKTSKKPIVNECDLVLENSELKKRIKQLEDKLSQIFAD